MESRTISLNGGDWQFKGYVGEDWLWRSAHLLQTRDLIGWNSATVPGSVQNDLWQAGLVADPYFEMNSLAIEWAADRTWLYKKTFRVDPSLRGSRIQLVFQGIDYTARIYLNDQLLGQSKGMFLPAAIEVGERLDFSGDNQLVVVIDPAPFEQPQIGYTSRVTTQKARMNYWWDFCPRMVHLGIWEDVFLRVSGPVRIADVVVRSELSADMLRADIEVTVSVDRLDGRDAVVEALLRQAGEEEVLARTSAVVPAGAVEALLRFQLDQPELWWPNGAGDQPLYEVETRVLSAGQLSDERQITFGIRRIEFVTNDGAPADALPYTLMVNGRKIYIQGWNWVPMDVLYGVEQAEKRERLLRLARAAQVNLLRVWGGGLIEKEAFYNLCDRLGILVWQEFIQSSSGIDNFPSSEAPYIEFLTENAAQAIRARRNHPALAVWCGGNELHFSPTNLCDDRHAALAALHDTVRRLDPGRHWVPTSPAGGVFGYGTAETEEDALKMQDVHGPWEYQGLRKQYALYNGGRSTLHSEFGVEGITNLRSLNRTIAAEHQWPVSLENPLWMHLAAWWVKEKVWAEVFGPFKDIETAQRATQFMQADGLRYAVEADRRRMYANGGTMPWQFNEPYPMAACTSAVDYFAEPKPVYYSVARAYQPLSITARFDTLAWGSEQDFTAQVWVANAGGQCTGDLEAQIVGLDGRVFHDKNVRVTCAENTAQVLINVSAPLAPIKGSLFFLDLALWDDSGVVAANRYLFSKADTLAPMLDGLPQVTVKAKVEKSGKTWKVTLENPADQAALWIWLEAEKSDLRAPGYAYFEDNYFCLLPGEQRQVQVRWSGTSETARAIRVAGWNFPALRLV